MNFIGSHLFTFTGRPIFIYAQWKIFSGNFRAQLCPSILAGMQAATNVEFLLAEALALGMNNIGAIVNNNVGLLMP